MSAHAQKWSFRITPVRVLMILIAALAAAIVVYRLIFGLGAVSNLNDQWPWGLWIGFDVLCGVALAGGGYGTALIVHILHIEKFSSIGRSAMLSSMLGYILVLIGLFLDIGQWFNFWRPFVSWGYHSVLFEVFWCVSLYTTVQVIEFGEIATERVGKKWHSFFKKILPVLLVIGVLLPTLHQSSLGGLYLTEVGKLHPIWWSPYIPVFFLMSSFFVGPAMVCVETALSGWAFKHKADLKVLRGLAKIGAVIMLLYTILKIVDFTSRDVWPYIFAGGLEGNMFLLEITLGVLIPLIIVFSPFGKTRKGLVTYGALTAIGLVINRLNVVITGMVNYYGPGYVPAWTEIVVTVGLVCGGILVYCFIVENFNIVQHDEESPA
ncbi:NrfD/PsrC family molybdoenzyme membrane anchor subunit [Peptococcaceae bacterium 1198_IL3148]